MACAGFEENYKTENLTTKDTNTLAIAWSTLLGHEEKRTKNMRMSSLGRLARRAQNWNRGTDLFSPRQGVVCLPKLLRCWEGHHAAEGQNRPQIEKELGEVDV